MTVLTLLRSEWPKLSRVLAILSAVGIMKGHKIGFDREIRKIIAELS